MTYTFKLARRLAVSRNYAMITTLVLLAACAADDPTAPDGLADAQWRDRGAAEVSVSPSTLTLETNQIARFDGRVRTPSEDSAAAVEWSATGGTISADGLFSSAQPGTFRVVGRGRQKAADTATVIVVAPQPTLASLTVAPTSVALVAGTTQQFSAVARLSDSTITTVGLVWTATGGTIDASGLYTAGTSAGTYRVIVTNTAGTVADTAVVTLTDPVPTPTPDPQPTLTQVVLSPASVSLLTGETKQFATYGRMSNGDSVSVVVTYSATGGTVTSSGLYTAGSTAGTFRVIAKSASGPADTATIALTAPALAPVVSSFVGIPTGGFHTPAVSVGSAFTGFLRVVYLPTLRATLDSARARKARLVLAVPRSSMRNADNTFNLAMWKQEVDRYRAFDFQPYINDGTLLGLYMIDEPDCGGCWGGKTIAQSTVDSMAQYVEAIWPAMVTFARVTPGWFKTYGPPRYLDVAWAQWEGPNHYPSANMTPEQFRDKNVADAKAMGLGLVLGLNTLDGGNGSSGITGTFQNSTSSTVNRWQMSAAEVEHAGSVFAAAPYVCAVLNWRWSPDYPTASYLSSTQLSAIRAFDNRTDVKAAFAKIAQVAASRAPASCRVR